MQSKTTKNGLRLGAEVVRVSKVNGRGGASYHTEDDQQEDMAALATRYGVDVRHSFKDVNQSGGTMDRPGLQGAIQLLREKKIDTILVAKLDRFARTTQGALKTLEEIEELGGTLVCGDLDVDTATSAGRMIFTQMATVAEFEKNRRKEGFARAATAATLRGCHIAQPPTGYLVTKGERYLIPDPQRARLIPELFDRRAAGESWNMIRDWWHAETGHWQKPSQFAKMLGNRTYLGTFTYGGVESGRPHPALVTPEQFEAVQTVRAPRSTRAKKPKALLAGVAICSSCDGRMTTGLAGKDVTVYRCQGPTRVGVNCPKPLTITASKVDEFVLAEMDKWAGKAEVETTGEYAAEFAAADARIANAEQALDDFMAAFSATVGVDRARANAERLQGEIDAAVEARDHLREHRAVAGLKLRAHDVLAGDDLEDKRILVTGGVESVIIRPTSVTATGGRARTPVADRVTVNWRAD